jgi:hypothetical protein
MRTGEPALSAPGRDAVTAAGAPDWCSDPRPWFTCPDCRHGLVWDDLDRGVLLVCVYSQCSAAGMEVPVWRAQQHREDRGIDRAVSAAGWPRPVLEGRPVPYVVPVTAGRPWWGLTHGDRLLRCQNSWACQVCGAALPARAWVLVDTRGAVSTDSAMHGRCLRLATASCPHLLAERSTLRAVHVRRGEIHGGGRPLSPRGAAWREEWIVPGLLSRPGTGGVGARAETAS